MAHVLDTAIWLWALDKDPLSIQLLVMSQYNCLLDLAPVVKGPFTAMCFDLPRLNVVYDFLRHADTDSKEGVSGVDFMPHETPCLLFDVICSFEDFFGMATPYMMAFLGYFPFWFKQDNSALSNAVGYELPKNFAAADFVGLSRQAAFEKLAKVFSEGPI